MTTLTLTPIEPCPYDLPGPQRWRTDSGRSQADVTAQDLARANELAERLLALDEPWAGRFMAYIASRAVLEGLAADDPLPSRARLVSWLLNHSLYVLARALLRAWTHEDERPGYSGVRPA